ncbi:MAG: hypothetical protein WB630_21860 [Candidatus Acidiferrales bacterium]
MVYRKAEIVNTGSRRSGISQPGIVDECLKAGKILRRAQDDNAPD